MLVLRIIPDLCGSDIQRITWKWVVPFTSAVHKSGMDFESNVHFQIVRLTLWDRLFLSENLFLCRSYFLWTLLVICNYFHPGDGHPNWQACVVYGTGWNSTLLCKLASTEIVFHPCSFKVCGRRSFCFWRIHMFCRCLSMLKFKATLEKYLKETENFLVHVCARHCQLLSTWAPTMRTFLKIPSTLDCVRSVLLARCCVYLKFHIFFASEHGACLTCLSLILALEGTSDFYFLNSKTCPFQMSNHFQMHWLTSWLTSSYSLFHLGYLHINALFWYSIVLTCGTRNMMICCMNSWWPANRLMGRKFLSRYSTTIYILLHGVFLAIDKVGYLCYWLLVFLYQVLLRPRSHIVVSIWFLQPSNMQDLDILHALTRMLPLLSYSVAIEHSLRTLQTTMPSVCLLSIAPHTSSSMTTFRFFLVL